MFSRSESAVRYPVSGKLKVVQSLQLPWFCHCLAKCSSWPCQNGGQSLWPHENVTRNLSSDQTLIPPVWLVLCPFFSTPVQTAGTHPITALTTDCAYNITELRRASRPLTHSSRLSLLVGSVRWGQVELRRQQYISTAGSADKLKLEQLLKHDTAIDLQMLGFSKTTVNMHNNTLNCSSNCTENKVCYKHKASRSVLHMKTIAVWNH